MISTKADASTIDEQVEKLTRELNIHYRACIGSLIYLLSRRVNLIFAVHKLAKFSSNPGKVYFEGMVHLLRYLRHNKNLGLKHYADMKYEIFPVLFRLASINPESKLTGFSDYSCKDCTETGRSTGAYIIFDQGGRIDNVTHVPGPVAKASTESEYNVA